MNKDSHLLFEAYQNIIEKVYLPGPQKMSGLNSSSMKKGEDAEEGICGQGCTCGKCPKCMPEKEEASEEEASEEEHHKAAKSHKKENPDATEEAIKHHLKKIFGKRFNEKRASKAAHHAVHSGKDHSSEDAEKKHVFTKVFKSAKKAGYSKKAAEKIAGAAKAKASEDDEEELGVDPVEAKEMEDIRLKYYNDVYRKIRSGKIDLHDFIEWCSNQDVMPLRGEDAEEGASDDDTGEDEEDVDGDTDGGLGVD